MDVIIFPPILNYSVRSLYSHTDSFNNNAVTHAMLTVPKGSWATCGYTVDFRGRNSIYGPPGTSLGASPWGILFLKLRFWKCDFRHSKAKWTCSLVLNYPFFVSFGVSDRAFWTLPRSSPASAFRKTLRYTPVSASGSFERWSHFFMKREMVICEKTFIFCVKRDLDRLVLPPFLYPIPD